MKKFLFLLIIVPLLSFNSIEKENNIVGKWKGVNLKNKIGYITFDEDGYASFEVDGKLMGGKNFDVKGKKASMTYSINFDTNPFEIDIKLSSPESTIQKSMLLIAQFKAKDTLILASNFNEIRPTEFNKDNSITLNRVK